MKQIRLLTFVLACLATTLCAQEDPLNNGLGLGYHVNQYQRDFGFGLNVTSPYFAGRHMAVRLRGNLMFNEHEKGGTTTVWSPYANVSLGLVGVGGMVNHFIRLYGEGGPLCLFPSPEFSSETAVFGGYGLFGFELFMSRSMNYFIEIGGVGSGAQADKIPKQPIYSNGLLINVGFRFTL